MWKTWNTDAPTLTVSSFRGLTNRLRVMLSGIALAEATGRHLRILWAPTRDCAARFAELFDNPPLAGVDMSHITIEDVPLDAVIDMPSINFRRRNHLPDVMTSNKRHIALEYVAWLIDPKQAPHHAPLFQRCAELMANLRPIPAIAEQAAKFRAGHFRPTMIGVHLRRGDMVFGYSDRVNNTSQALDAVDRYLDMYPGAGIFLATDDGAIDQHTGNVHHEGIRDIFQRRYGERVVSTTPRSLDRRSAIAIQDALVDLLLLRATDAVVGTLGSSFSDMAAFGRDVPLTLCAGNAPLEPPPTKRPTDLWSLTRRLSYRLWRHFWSKINPAVARRQRLHRWSLD